MDRDRELCTKATSRRRPRSLGASCAKVSAGSDGVGDGCTRLSDCSQITDSISRRLAERRPGSIGHITLRGKCAGARSAGKPHAACDVAGAGNGLTVRLVRHSHRKRGETDRPRLRSTAPALDPTVVNEVLSRFTMNALRAFFSTTPATHSCPKIQTRCQALDSYASP